MNALVRVLALDPGKRDKVAGYYHSLEVGTLDPEPVDRRVWEVLADVFKANVRRLASFEPPPLAAVDTAVVYQRVQDAPHLASVDALGEVRAAPQERDEVDRLFTGTA